MMLKVYQGSFQNGGRMFHMHARVLAIELCRDILEHRAKTIHSLVFPEIFITRGRYLKYLQRFKRKILISAMHQNDGIKCLKFNANL